MQRFSLTTLGCKVNQYDGNAVALLLRRAGWVRVAPPQQADLAVINTCCVTSTAMARSRQAIRKAVRQSPGAAILVIGCYSNYDTERIQQLLGSHHVPRSRTMIAGHHDGLPGLERFLRRVSTANHSERETGNSGNDESMTAGCLASSTTIPNPTYMRTRRDSAVKQNIRHLPLLKEIDRFEDHRRAFVKVQDGCDAFCSYCIVPYTRPYVWSKDPDSVEAECRNLLAAGHKEIVLCGVFLGAFGRGTAVRGRWAKGRPSALPQLVVRVGRIEGLWRVRLSSLEPGDLTDELLAACLDTPTFAPHFHLPLQSGSRRILRSMNRRYTPDGFGRTVNRLRDAFDRPAITTDVMVGFPGETDEDFAATLALARRAGFAKIHAFPFSPIEPTAAWKRRDQAPPRRVVSERMAALQELERDLAEGYAGQFVGESMETLVERSRSGGNGRLQGMTDRYLRVSFDPPPGKSDELIGEVVRVRIERTSGRTLSGTPL